jgi:hypothetical protein
VYDNLNLQLWTEISFRGIAFDIAGKYLKHDNTWSLLVHIEEKSFPLGSNNEPYYQKLNTQIILDEEHIRSICMSIEELSNKDLVRDIDIILSVKKNRWLIFNSLNNFLDVLISKDKSKIAVKLLKYIAL